MGYQDESDDFLMSGGGVSCQFPKKGHSFTGTVLKIGKPRPQTDPESGDVKTFKSGDVRKTMPVTLATDARGHWVEGEYEEIEDDDGERVLYVQGLMKNAVRDAVRKAFKDGGKPASAARLEVGGLLTVRWDSTIPPARKGLKPTKVYVAEYVLAEDNKANAHLLDDEDDPFDDED
jgi:hypothetical protein